MVHQCFYELVKAMDKNAIEADSDPSQVVVNVINPGWCGTELSRAKPSNQGEKVCFALTGWTAERGSRAYTHALDAGREIHGRYLSECHYKAESLYVRSERCRRIQAKM
jgi:retinol dehydrogenase-12